MKASRQKITALAFLLFLSQVVSGCGAMMAGLRRDLDDMQGEFDRPTIGGKWAERGFLSEGMGEAGYAPERYSALGHSERGPASVSARGSASGSWLDGERAEANARDRYRQMGEEIEEDAEELGISSASTPNLRPSSRRLYKNGTRATRADFIDESTNEGSLWASDGQTNYFFTKNKIRGVGDLVSITLEQDMIRDIAAEVRRTLSPREKEFELAMAQEKVKQRLLNPTPAQAAENKDAIGTSAAAPQSAGKNEKVAEEDIPDATVRDIDLTKALELKPNDSMMAEILERYPNGNYRIRATKKVNYKNGPPRLVSLVGVVRGSDISEEDLVPSGKLYEYRLEAIR